MGGNRELKWLLEKFWQGKLGADELGEGAAHVRQQNWDHQTAAKLDLIPVGDFSLYDHVLDWSERVGAVPQAYQSSLLVSRLDRYFAMARGSRSGVQLPALEMTKWFNTNYHYLVPQWRSGQPFQLDAALFLQEVALAKSQGLSPRPVILGPVSLLSLGKMTDSHVHPLSLLPKILPVYRQLLEELAALGIEWVQWDEPVLALDIDQTTRDAIVQSTHELADLPTKLLLTSYFASIADQLPWVCQLPVEGIHLDLPRDPQQLDVALQHITGDKWLSLGLIDGRNIWRTDLDQAIPLAQKAADQIGADRLMIAPGCSLLHVPVDLQAETELDEELKSWLAFAVQKLDEIQIITTAINEGTSAVAAHLAASRQAIQSRKSSTRIKKAQVRDAVGQIVPEMQSRNSPFPQRQIEQRKHLQLPLFPTTTIGSFPQTPEVRQARSAFRKGEILPDAYQEFLEAETTSCIKRQESIGLDVLVHGEFERNDMVEYFG